MVYKPDYESWSYENLLNVLIQLKQYPNDDVLAAEVKKVKREIGSRKYALLGFIKATKVKEYGRWRTASECELLAKKMGLPLGSPITINGTDKCLTLKVEKIA